ncbi:hypothetical protein KSP40_PGU002752 [Platanthera guangdongensis]|uniref:Dehydrogenase E1 component domain-containing protein n=1 Tax=Platanthera guangdongensis TaxID=2320717 RepID=A0ABR2M7D7_9ASPA
MALICHSRSIAARLLPQALSALPVIGRRNAPKSQASLGNEPGRRLASARAGESVSPLSDECRNQVLDFPGGKLMFSPDMRFLSGSTGERLSEKVAVKMYRDMITLQVMDTIFFEAQRQGRISFYLTSTGEEAINIASAAALSNEDVIFPQYREPGVLLWRGFTLQEFANQCFGNRSDYGKGRQMPIHYGSRKFNYFTVSSPIATQLPQAVGAAYSLKMDKKNACAGDFHAALNFAAVMEAPVIFFCRNNGDGVVTRGQAYGIRSIRVDGNDALAVYSAVHMAREMAALTYRVGHHSTSDDSTKYRLVDEIEHWRSSRDPISRYRLWLERNGWWCDDAESELRSSVRKELLQAIQVAEREQKPALGELFSDVYDIIPSNLREQEQFLRHTVKKHPGDYPHNVPA